MALVERQTVECGGVLYKENRHEPDIEDIPDVSYSAGEFDGSIGLEAEYFDCEEYYAGWTIGHRKYLQRQNMLDTPENSDDIPF